MLLVIESTEGEGAYQNRGIKGRTYSRQHLTRECSRRVEIFKLIASASAYHPCDGYWEEGACMLHRREG